MKILNIDLETYSAADLKKCGVYKYTSDPSFEILMFAYKVDDNPTKIVDFMSFEDLPDEIFDALTDPSVLKTAFNSQFERLCLNAKYGINIPVEQWECTMVKSLIAGLPGSLGNVSTALGLDVQKDVRGQACIRFFSIPCKPTKANGERTRNFPHHDPEKWQLFLDYCVKDVEVEYAIRQRLSHIEWSDTEKQVWWADQRMNDLGVRIDRTLVKNAVRMDLEVREKLMAEARELTGLTNPNSGQQLMAWLQEETGDEVTTLRKADVPIMLEKYDGETIQRVLRIRQELAKTSVKKYAAFGHACQTDGRVRGLFQYYGANRTGRDAGRLVQLQNLARNSMKDIDLARQVVRSGDLDLVELIFENVPDTLSQLIRTTIVPEKGNTLLATDYSAIEARVLAWLANEQWVIDVFKTHGKLYEATASEMFNIPLAEITKDSDHRQKGKVASLACGYQGGVGALVAMGALKMGLQEDELQGIIDAWRAANPAIVAFWATINRCAISAVGGTPAGIKSKGIKFYMEKGDLICRLPSGRKLCYHKAKLKRNNFGGVAVTYMGTNQVSKRWETVDTYGGKLVENITQAVARDLLMYALLELEKFPWLKATMRVHDELVMEAPEERSEEALTVVNKIMSTAPDWCADLPLKGESQLLKYYRK